MSEAVLVKPSLAELPSYLAALQSGWSPDNIRKMEAVREQLAAIAADADAFLASLEDRDAKGPPLRLPDGSTAPRLPSFRRWIWDGEFCGSIGFRWQNHTSGLPEHVPGHIGYAIVPWKRGAGHAKRGLSLMLLEACQQGLDYVELTTDPDNLASQRVIAACGGRLVERFRKPSAFDDAESLRFRIDLKDSTSPS